MKFEKRRSYTSGKVQNGPRHAVHGEDGHKIRSHGRGFTKYNSSFTESRVLMRNFFFLLLSTGFQTTAPIVVSVGAVPIKSIE